MGKQVTLTIDGKTVSVPAGTLVVDAAKEIGIDIPVFCYHPKMEPVGMCRMCLVEIGRPTVDRATGELVKDENGAPKITFAPKLETACTTPVSEGMVVIGMNDKVKAARSEVVEFLLTSHPLDCPICDKGGECPLQNLTIEHGPAQSRFLYEDKKHNEKHHPLGDLIFLDRERCIQCARCVRFQKDIAGDPVIGFYNRGRSLEITTFSEPGFDSYFSGNTTDICPVGALTTADFRFRARPWEMKQAASLCTHCAVGCNLTLNVRREAKTGGASVVKRVMPRQNEMVNEIWICDKARFGYHFTDAENRLTTPLVRNEKGELEPVSWEVALARVADQMRLAGSKMVTLAGGRLSNEDLFNLQQLTKVQGGKCVLDTDMGGGDLVARFGLPAGSNFADMGKGTVILVAACDLEEEAPIWWLRVKQAASRGASVIVINPRPTKTEQFAKRILRVGYGQEAILLDALLPDSKATDEDILAAGREIAGAENLVVIFGAEGAGLSTTTAIAEASARLLSISGRQNKINSGLLAAWPNANTQGAWELGFRPAADLQSLLAPTGVLYVAGADPLATNNGLADALKKNAACLVVQDLCLTETAKAADVVLPALPFTHREGTYTNGERRVQRFYQAVPFQIEAYADFSITARLANQLGQNLEEKSASQVFEQIAAQNSAFAGLTYATLAETPVQHPLIGRQDVYYGGTSYDNHQGIGQVLALAAEPQGASDLPDTRPARLPAAEGSTALAVVPVTRLYDQGGTLVPSQLLHPRMVKACLLVNPVDCQRLGIQPGEQVQISVDGRSYTLEIGQEDGIPNGVGLIPRSVGVSIHGPALAQVKRIAVTA